MDSLLHNSDLDRHVTQKQRFGAARKILPLILGAAAAAALAWYGWSWWEAGRYVQSTDDAYVGGDITPVSPRIAGFIAELAVSDNQRVKAGDLLVKLDDRDDRAALARAAANVTAQQAALANLAATRNLQEAMIAQAEAEITATEAEVARTRDDVARYRTLTRDQIASVQRFQQADADYKKAVAADRKSRAALDAAQRRLNVIDTQRQEARASLDEAIAARDIARLNLGYTEIRAPMDGVVGNRSARLGAYVTAGTQLLSLVPADGLWVDANFKENQLGGLHAGQKVSIAADALPGARFDGVVASLAPATGAQFSIIPPENATGNFTRIVQRVPVRIRLSGAAAQLGELRPGLSVTVAVDERAAAAASQEAAR
jgi:membrane fusion protein, multidrug efflux system